MPLSFEKGEILTGISSLIDKGEMTIVEAHIFLLKQVIIKLTEERKPNSSEGVDFLTWKQQGTKILEQIAPTERKITMFRATKEMLDSANQDVEELREELEGKLMSTRDRIKFKISDIEPMKKWVDREKGVTAEEFIEDNWKTYIDAGLVDRVMLRAYDRALTDHLEQCKAHLLVNISIAGEKTQNDLNDLAILGYTSKDISRLKSKAMRS